MHEFIRTTSRVIFGFLFGLLVSVNFLTETWAFENYLVCIYGLPQNNLLELQRAGVNSLLIRQRELEKAAQYNLTKIYDLGVTPKGIKNDMNFIQNNLKFFRDNFGPNNLYYLGDDLKCAHKYFIDEIKSFLNISKGFVGIIKGIECYDKDNIFIYHYPLMRRQLSLEKMLQHQVEAVNKVKALGNKLYLHVQAHPQFWYRELVERSKVGQHALLYPDGQVTRMLIYYAVATGAAGYSLFHHRSLEEPTATERVWGISQALLETKPLYPVLARAEKVEFFKLGSGAYGTRIKSQPFDIFFLFTSDTRSLYHPSSRHVRIAPRDIPHLSNYQLVREYFRGKILPVGEELRLPQDYALILLAGRDIATLAQPLDFDRSYYRDVLQRRAQALANNLASLGLPIPVLKIHHDNLEEQINYLLSYIDELNELKREAWLARAKDWPTDGELLNTMYFKGLLKYPFKEPFNFYYQ